MEAPFLRDPIVRMIVSQVYMGLPPMTNGQPNSWETVLLLFLVP